MKHQQVVLLNLAKAGTGRRVNGEYVPPVYEKTAVEVVLEIDVDAIARKLAYKAIANKSGKSEFMLGLVKAYAKKAAVQP